MNKFMEEALKEAAIAFELGEVPIGAVIEKDGQIIARGHNLTETLKDPTAHAEMIALREAARVLGGWRLLGCNLYVTIEPCSMCAGAMVWSRIDNLYIGAMDPKAGACGSVFQIPCCDKLNHQINVETGIMEEECSSIMREFFVRLRNRKKNSKSKYKNSIILYVRRHFIYTRFLTLPILLNRLISNGENQRKKEIYQAISFPINLLLYKVIYEH